MKRFLICCFALFLEGCGSLRWPLIQADDYWVKPGVSRPASQVESLLVYADYARGLTGAELPREHERLGLAFAAQNRSDMVRLRYALLLTVAGAPGRDLPRARQMLDPLLKEDGHDADLRRMATYVNVVIGDLLDAERRLREEQRRASDLDQKLEALKSIERRIIQRTAPETNR